MRTHFGPALQNAARRAIHYLETISERRVNVTAAALAGLSNLGGPMPAQGEDTDELVRLAARRRPLPVRWCAGTLRGNWFLEYHHVVPYADGGQTTADNLELRCRAHNRYEAELWSGAALAPSTTEERLMW